MKKWAKLAGQGAYERRPSIHHLFGREPVPPRSFKAENAQIIDRTWKDIERLEIFIKYLKRRKRQSFFSPKMPWSRSWDPQAQTPGSGSTGQVRLAKQAVQHCSANIQCSHCCTMHCKSANKLPLPAVDPATCNRPVQLMVLRNLEHVKLSNTQRNPKSRKRFRILLAFKTRNTIAIVCEDISGFELNDAESHRMLVIRPAWGFGLWYWRPRFDCHDLTCFASFCEVFTLWL